MHCCPGQSASWLQLTAAMHMPVNTSQRLPFGHSVSRVQPPCAGTHAPALHPCPLGQSASCLHIIDIGKMQKPELHTSPLGQSASALHVVGGGLAHWPFTQIC